MIFFRTLSKVHASSSQPRLSTALTKSLCGSVVIEDGRRINELTHESRFGAAQFRKGGPGSVPIVVRRRGARHHQAVALDAGLGA